MIVYIKILKQILKTFIFQLQWNAASCAKSQALFWTRHCPSLTRFIPHFKKNINFLCLGHILHRSTGRTSTSFPAEIWVISGPLLPTLKTPSHSAILSVPCCSCCAALCGDYCMAMLVLKFLTILKIKNL